MAFLYKNISELTLAVLEIVKARLLFLELIDELTPAVLDALCPPDSELFLVHEGC